MYKNFKQIEYDLKRLSLERQIAMEEIIGLKGDIADDLSPYNWISTAFSAVKKFGVLYMVKKIIK